MTEEIIDDDTCAFCHESLCYENVEELHCSNPKCGISRLHQECFDDLRADVSSKKGYKVPKDRKAGYTCPLCENGRILSSKFFPHKNKDRKSKAAAAPGPPRPGPCAVSAVAPPAPAHAHAHPLPPKNKNNTFQRRQEEEHLRRLEILHNVPLKDRLYGSEEHRTTRTFIPGMEDDDARLMKKNDKRIQNKNKPQRPDHESYAKKDITTPYIYVHEAFSSPKIYNDVEEQQEDLVAELLRLCLGSE